VVELAEDLHFLLEEAEVHFGFRHTFERHDEIGRRLHALAHFTRGAFAENTHDLEASLHIVALVLARYQQRARWTADA